METGCSFESSVNFCRTISRQILEDSTLCGHIVVRTSNARDFIFHKCAEISIKAEDQENSNWMHVWTVVHIVDTFWKTVPYAPEFTTLVSCHFECHKVDPVLN